MINDKLRLKMTQQAKKMLPDDSPYISYAHETPIKDNIPSPTMLIQKADVIDNKSHYTTEDVWITSSKSPLKTDQFNKDIAYIEQLQPTEDSREQSNPRMGRFTRNLYSLVYGNIKQKPNNAVYKTSLKYSNVKASPPK